MERAIPNQPIDEAPFSSARIQNLALEAIEDYHRRKRLGDPGNIKDRLRQLDQIKIKNNSCGDRLRGEVLKICTPLVDELDPQHLWFSGAATDAKGCFAILKKDAREGDIEWGQVSGVTLALVDVSNESHTRATIESGSTTLVSTDDGPILIMHKPTGTGVLECVVLIENPCLDTQPGCPECTGTATWVWDTPTNQWTETSNTCGFATTTDPCGCEVGDGSACSGVYPDFCGVTDGDTTITSCSACDVLYEVDCIPDECDCSTTTTLAPCTGTCYWVGVPVAATPLEGQWNVTGYRWAPVSNTCGATCGPCELPGTDPTSCNQTTSTPCTTIETDPGTEGGVTGCRGSCLYYYIPELDQVLFIRSDCTHTNDGSDCACVAPTFTPSSASCVPIVTQCASINTSVDLCWHCYTTTTTSAPCGSRCVMRGDGSGGWTEASGDCDVSCPCADPVRASTGTGDTASSYCTPTNSTTTCKPDNETCLLSCSSSGVWVELVYLDNYCCNTCCLPGTSACAGETCDPDAIGTGAQWGACENTSSTTTAPPPPPPP